MADISIIGHITNIRFKEHAILVYVDENRLGYKRADGTRVDAKVVSWKCIFNASKSKRDYINKFFARGMLVQVKGDCLPYAVDQGDVVDGYTVFIQTINKFPYPTTTIRKEQRLIKESQEHSDEKPNLKDYQEPDF